MISVIRRYFRPLDRIPVYIPCFNSVSYARGMTCQLRDRGLKNIILVDNGSTYPGMVDFLTAPGNYVSVVRYNENKGPRHIFLDLDTYDPLPSVFCVTDPDLLFNDAMPKDFMKHLVALSERFKVGKVGLALEIADHHLMRQEDFLIEGNSYKIWEWERQFWSNYAGKTLDGEPIYRAQIDTTFAIYNKRYFSPTHYTTALRVAGRYTCRHLPWYRDVGMPQDEETFYRRTAKTSYYFK